MISVLCIVSGRLRFCPGNATCLCRIINAHNCSTIEAVVVYKQGPDQMQTSVFVALSHRQATFIQYIQ